MAQGTAGISGTSIAIVLIGGTLVYSGLKNKKFSSAARALISGQDPATATPYDLSGAGNIQGADSGIPTTSGGQVPVGPPANATAQANQLLGRTLAAPFGWATGNEWDSLVALWTRESGWSNTADTRKTGAGGDNMSSPVWAYGIAQARPADKYPLPGRPPDIGGVADPTSQILWGLSYIKGRYGSPSAAWAHESANSWY